MFVTEGFLIHTDENLRLYMDNEFKILRHCFIKIQTLLS